MTHEYVIALGGSIEPAQEGPPAATPTAIAWAADSVLAVGSDDVVRAISRGDSTFLALDGCTVTALPTDLDAAEAALREAATPPLSASRVAPTLIVAGLLDSEPVLEPGSSADLAFWDTRGPRLVAVVRAGVFDDGDPRRGPFSSPSL